MKDIENSALEESIIESIEDRKNVEDEAENSDPSPAAIRYSISSYGADPDVEGLVKRLKRGEILVPDFQRKYVWTIKEASKFIESLLLGLPVPGVFFAKEEGSNKQLVIDGQQRLKSLQFYYDGYFNPREKAASNRIFKLVDVDPRFNDRTYLELEESDRIALNDSIIHATVVKQEAPSNDDTGIYHLFARLNSGGQRLTSQEIRVAASSGGLISQLFELNKIPSWREIYGKESPRLKDQELILRFLALYFHRDRYEKPISEFLNKFCSANRNPSQSALDEYRDIFLETINLVYNSIGKSAFRPERSLNTAVFDAVMIGLAERLKKGRIRNLSEIAILYSSLLSSQDFRPYIERATSDEANVSGRIGAAIRAFSKLR